MSNGPIFLWELIYPPKAEPQAAATFLPGVQFDSQSIQSTATNNVGTSFSDTSLTIGTQANRALIVTIGLNSNPGSALSLTWDGVALTQLVLKDASDTSSETAIFGLLNPASGAKVLAGSWLNSEAFSVAGVSFYNVEQASLAKAFTGAATAEGPVSPATISVVSAVGDWVVAAQSASFTALTPDNNRIYSFRSVSGFGASANRAARGLFPTVTLSATESANQTWTAAGINIKPPSEIGWLTPFGAPVRVRLAQQPSLFAFSPFPITTVVTPYAGWDDTLEWPQPPQPRSMAYAAPFIAQTLGTFQARDNFGDWTNWPDFAPRRPRVPLHQPWNFIPSPAQVWFPTAPWDDLTRRKQPPINTQPLAFVPVVVAVQAQVWYPPNTWPDFAPKARPAIDANWLAFLSPVPTATVIGDWPDFIRRKPQPIDTQPLSWSGQPIAVQQVWFPYDPWPSLIAKKPAALNFTPATPFIQTPAQVFFPYGPWDDFARRKAVAQDTQRFAWHTDTPAPPAPTFFLVPDRWPDYVRAKAAPLNFNPLAQVQLAPQVWFPYGPWDDFARRKPSPLIYPPFTLVPINVPTLGYIQWPDFATKKRPPLNYVPLTFVQTIRTPWNELSRWPELVPIRGKAGLHAALQQFAARFPGVITQATVTGILAAFEANTDAAGIAVYVVQSQPAVRAAVSIQEIGTI